MAKTVKEVTKEPAVKKPWNAQPSVLETEKGTVKDVPAVIKSPVTFNEKPVPSLGTVFINKTSEHVFGSVFKFSENIDPLVEKEVRHLIMSSSYSIQELIGGLEFGIYSYQKGNLKQFLLVDEKSTVTAEDNYYISKRMDDCFDECEEQVDTEVKTGHGIVVDSQLTECSFLKKSNLVMSTHAEYSSFNGHVLVKTQTPSKSLRKESIEHAREGMAQNYVYGRAPAKPNMFTGLTIRQSTVVNSVLAALVISDATIYKSSIEATSFGRIKKSTIELAYIKAQTVTIERARANVHFNGHYFTLTHASIWRVHFNKEHSVTVNHVSCVMNIEIHHDWDKFFCYTTDKEMCVILPYYMVKQTSEGSVVRIPFGQNIFDVTNLLRDSLSAQCILNQRNTVSESMLEYLARTISERSRLVLMMRASMALAPKPELDEVPF